MFTGLIQSKGEVLTRHVKDNNYTFTVASKFTDMSDVALGDSITMNGICLTVTGIQGDVVSVDVSRETINLTDAKSWTIGTVLNLEKSLALKDKLGGHMVSGHVDSLAKCVKIEPSGTSIIYGFQIPPSFDKFIVKKGSVAINGVSLTVNEIEDCVLYVNIIPHTLAMTNLGLLALGDMVNFEIDTIARYEEKMLRGFTS